MNRETFRAAKLAAIVRYKTQAQQDLNKSITKRQHNNAVRRFNRSVKKERVYQGAEWTAEMEREYLLYKDCDDISSIPGS